MRWSSPPSSCTDPPFTSCFESRSQQIRGFLPLTSFLVVGQQMFKRICPPGSHRSKSSASNIDSPAAQVRQNSKHTSLPSMFEGFKACDMSLREVWLVDGDP